MGVQIELDFCSQQAPLAACSPMDLAEGPPAGCSYLGSSNSPVATGASGSAEPSARAALEAILRDLTGLELALHLTDNERTMISTRREGERVTVRLHHMFLLADRETVLGLAGYLEKSDERAALRLGRFIEQHRARIRRAQPRRVHLRPTGAYHDLRQIFDQLNTRHFGGQVAANITWGRRTTVQGRLGEPADSHALPAGRRRASRRSIKLGSYNSGNSLIRIHPVLDAAWVPGFFVAYIVYHEMLHQAVPPAPTGGRRAFHGREFRDHERRFFAYERAITWERHNLRRLLQA